MHVILKNFGDPPNHDSRLSYASDTPKSHDERTCRGNANDKKAAVHLNRKSFLLSPFLILALFLFLDLLSSCSRLFQLLLQMRFLPGIKLATLN